MIMDEFVTKRSLYHAKTGNFTGFCVSISSDLNENKLDELYDHFLEIRGKMSNIDPETETWFTIDEFVEYQNNPQDITTMLFEVATTATRKRLRRAAKRTSKRRSRKRFIRRRVRKNRDQLKKRAYGQVKTILRKRLSGGRPWSKISLSTRASIDNSINKRKSILMRMVKTRLPKMAGQETKRLQRVRLNSSFEPYYDNLLTESKRGPSAKSSLAQSTDSKQNKKDKARARQAKRREKIANNITEFIKTVFVAKIGGQYELIEKASVGDKQTDKTQLTSIGQALSFCKKTKDGEFRTTETSKKLCGDLRGTSKSEERKSKGKTKMASSSNSSNNPADEGLPIIPEIPYGEQPGDPMNLPEKLRGGKDGFVINENFAAVLSEKGIVLASRMNRSGNDIIEEDLQDIQDLLENKENLTNDDVDMIDEIYDRLNDSGLSEKDILTLISNKDLFSASVAQYKSAFTKQDIEGNIVSKSLSGVGVNNDTIDNYALIEMGTGKVGVLNSELDGTSKSDIVAVHIPTVLAFLQKTNADLTEKQLNDLIVQHMNNMNIGTGGSSKNKKIRNAGIQYYEKFQEWIANDKSEEADTLRTFNSENGKNFQGFVGISVKAGSSRLGSSNVSGDALNTLQEAHKRASSLSTPGNDNGTALKDFQTQSNKLFETINTGTLTAKTISSTYEQSIGNAQDSTSKVEETKQELTKILQDMTSVDALKNPHNREFVKQILFISLTGETRISSISPGIATHLFVSDDPKSINADVFAIDDNYVEMLLKELEKGPGASSLIINFVGKSGGLTSKEERMYEEKFNSHVDDILKRLKKGETVGKLTPKSKKKDVEDEILGNIYSSMDKLDDLNGNRDELINKLKNEGQDPKDVTSELYLVTNDIRDKRYTVRIVLNIIKNMDNIMKNIQAQKNDTSFPLKVESFSFNPILNFLVEQYSVLKEEQTENEPNQTIESLEAELKDYINRAKRSIGTGPDMLGKLIKFFEMDFDIFTNNINFADIVMKEGSGYNNTNSIFINDKEIKVPISEYYRSIGKLFLSEAKKKRDYTKDIEYESSPKQRHNRVKRVLARRFMEKKGLVHKGDGKDVDHKDGNPTNNSPKNLRVMSRSKNRAKH